MPISLTEKSFSWTHRRCNSLSKEVVLLFRDKVCQNQSKRWLHLLSCPVLLVVICAICMSISSSSAGIVSQTESFKQRTLKHFGPCIMATSQFLVLQHMCMHSCMFFTGPRSLKMPANWPPLRVTLYSMSSCPQLYSSRIVWPKTAEKQNYGKSQSRIGQCITQLSFFLGIISNTPYVTEF